LILARLRIAEGDFAGVNAMLERMLKTAEEQKRLGSVLEVLLTLNLAYHAQGNHPQATLMLNQALSMAEPEGYTRLFVDEGETLRLQLETLAQDHKHPLEKYLSRLLSGFQASAEIVLKPKANPHTIGMIEPLTERELQVLRLIAQGLSNSEISQKLFLALSTIKGHNLRIFNKLQAQNRTEAVASARNLGLL
jgi:LuxR family transcriptional regulator, maltose regulon positive regulatory protein